MARIEIKSIQELKAFQQKIKVLIAAFPFVQNKAIIEVAKNDILEQMKKKMQLSDFSQKIIDATFVGPIITTPGKIQVHYISNYEADNGFDVSVGREEGTKDHFIRPKKKGGSLRWQGDDGVVHFSKGHEVSGIERLLIIERTIQENQSQVTTLYGESLADSASQILGV
jgi:hypothetical protein